MSSDESSNPAMNSSNTEPPALNLPDQRNPNATSESQPARNAQFRSTNSTQVIDISDDTYQVEGIDFIIHNMYAEKGFITFRKWFGDDADAMLKRVASHVEQKLYSILSMQLSKHSCVIVCASDKDVGDWPEGALVG